MTHLASSLGPQQSYQNMTWDLAQLLADRFGMTSFRPGQREVIERVLAGTNTLAIFPTGGGKSLCYQLPAIVMPNVTLIVSPLLALMREQVASLNQRGICAVRIDSTLTAQEYQANMGLLRDGTARLLYVAPERLFNERFRATLEKIPVSMLAIDEAHCISQWGHNFRPDYLRLKDAVAQWKIPTVLALTATATREVAADIRSSFSITAADEIRTPFRRPNLALRFHSVKFAQRNDLLESILEGVSGPTIVYTTLQKTAESVAAFLQERGMHAAAYHAGMEDDDRRKIQDEFMASDDMIVVATIAFGMGVDKANIRQVIHYNMSSGLESYAQEIGRAGRDGMPSTCHMMIVPEDRVTIENFAYGDTPSAESLEQFVQFIAKQNEAMYLSHYAAAYEFDMNETVIRTILTYLELDGYLKAIGPRYDCYQFKPIKPLSWIVQQFEGDRKRFADDVLNMAVRKRIWTELNMAVASQKLGQPRDRIAAMLEYFAEQGWIELKPSGLMAGYRRVKPLSRPSVVSRNIMQQIVELESRAVRRIDDLLSLAVAEECQSMRLANHFVDKTKRECKKCSYCLGEHVELSKVEPSPASLPSSIAGIVATMRKGYPEIFSDARRMAKFLCGVSTPLLIRRRLTRHDSYGACRNYTIPDILAMLENYNQR